MDKRVSKTYKTIQEAFFSLLEEKDVHSITISELCIRADINRSTFYTHFEDLPAFIKHVENEVVERCLSCSSLYHYDTNTTDMLDTTFQTIQNNKNLFSLLFKYTNETDCWELYKKKFKEKTIPYWIKISGLDEIQVNLLLEFYFGGIFSILKTWYDSECSIDWKIVKNLLENTVRRGLYYYVYPNHN